MLDVRSERWNASDRHRHRWRTTPENREANKREGEEYLRVLLEEAGGRRVIGEDLGVVPEYVRPIYDRLASLGLKFRNGKCAMA